MSINSPIQSSLVFVGQSASSTVLEETGRRVNILGREILPVQSLILKPNLYDSSTLVATVSDFIASEIQPIPMLDRTVSKALLPISKSIAFEMLFPVNKSIVLETLKFSILGV
ncbi:MAG: hypothetical protein KME64_03890 [Scytonematopsis contorta HA4267-MV1]|nr:hypothetical protein [Scytonematopsis contorta HA4267-MV1]